MDGLSLVEWKVEDGEEEVEGGGEEMLFFKFVFSIIIVIRISDLIYSYNPISSTNFKIRKAAKQLAKTNFKTDFFNSYLRIEKNSHKRIFMSNRDVEAQ